MYSRYSRWKPENAITSKRSSLTRDLFALSVATKPCRRFDERVEHGLQIEGRAADDLEHVGGRGLLLQRFAQLFEQAGNCTPTSLLPGKRGVEKTKKAPSRFGSPVPVRRR